MRRWLYLAAAAALVVVIAAAIQIEDWLTHIEYPFTVWRMDLDDALVGVGTILIGSAAMWTVWLKARDAERKADRLAARVNGGLAALAEQHVAAATLEAQEAGHYVELLTRVTSIEKQRDDCHMELEAVRVELGQIQDWVVARLDETGNGRSTPR